MSQPARHEITALLEAWGGGDKSALDRLMPLVYDELRRLAHRYMSHERPGHTLQTTALVNEATAANNGKKFAGRTGHTSLLFRRR